MKKDLSRREGGRRREMRALFLVAFAALLACGFAVGADAQEPGEAGATGTGATAEAEPQENISTRADALETWLEEIRKAGPTKRLEQSAAQLETLQTEAAATTQRTEALLAGPAAPVDVEAQTSRWELLTGRFAALQGEVRNETAALEAARTKIADQTEQWKRTREDALNTKAPAALLRAIDQVLAELASANKQVKQELASGLQLLEQIEEARRGLRPILERVQSAKQALSESLRVAEDEPIWRSLPDGAEFLALPGEIGSRLASSWAELAPTWRARQGALVLQVLAFFVIGWLLGRIRSTRTRLHADPPDEGPDALRHPWALAYLIAILAMPYLQLEGVRILQLLVMPLALAAWFRVLSGMLVPALRTPLLAVTLLASAELFRFVLPGLPIANRFLLGLDLAVALAGILWLRRPERLREIPWRAAQSPWLRLMGAWMWLLLPTLAAGLLAVLLGNTTLADRIATFAIWGTVTGGAWAAVVLLAEESTLVLVKSGGLGLLRMVRTSPTAVLRVLQHGLRVLGLFAWAYATLTLAGFWSPVRSALDGVLSTSIGYGTVSVSLGGVLGFFLTLWIAWLIARFTSFALEEEVFSRVRTAPGVSFALSTFIRYAILVMGFLVAMGAIGFSIDRVALLLSALGVGIGFGLQNVVNNFVSGVILLFERPIRVGDRIQLGSLAGIVSTIGIRSSRLRTFDGSDVIVPNGDLIAGQLINWTFSDQKRRIVLPIGVAYGSRPREVIELLSEVTRSQPQILSDPEPVVVFRAFGASSLDFEIRAFTEGDWVQVMSDLAVAANDALEDAGITIPFPQRDLHLKNLAELRETLREPSESGPSDRA